MLSDSARLLRQQMSYPEEYWQVLMQSLENWQASGIAFDRFEWHQEIYPLAYTAIGQSFNNRDAAQFPTYAESLTQALIQILKKLKSDKGEDSIRALLPRQDKQANDGKWDNRVYQQHTKRIISNWLIIAAIAVILTGIIWSMAGAKKNVQSAFKKTCPPLTPEGENILRLITQEFRDASLSISETIDDAIAPLDQDNQADIINSTHNLVNLTTATIVDSQCYIQCAQYMPLKPDTPKEQPRNLGAWWVSIVRWIKSWSLDEQKSDLSMHAKMFQAKADLIREPSQLLSQKLGLLKTKTSALQKLLRIGSAAPTENQAVSQLINVLDRLFQAADRALRYIERNDNQINKGLVLTLTGIYKNDDADVESYRKKSSDKLTDSQALAILEEFRRFLSENLESWDQNRYLFRNNSKGRSSHARGPLRKGTVVEHTFREQQNNL